MKNNRSYTVEGLSPYYRKIYDNQLAMQPQLAKEWEELNKRVKTVRKGVVYLLPKNWIK